MTLDEVLDRLFPAGHDMAIGTDGLFTGHAGRRGGGRIAVIGVANGVPLGAAGALRLAAHVLGVVDEGGDTPILVVVDTEGQKMARREEMIGLNEYLAHLAKCLLLASHRGHRTIGLEYGRAAAGAFLATALAADILAALPDAEPAVMDLPSMARVTKLPEDRLRKLAETTSIFAPGLGHLAQTGAIAEIWDPNQPLHGQLEATLARVGPNDVRDQLGAERKGRLVAAKVARLVMEAATGTGHDAAAA